MSRKLHNPKSYSPAVYIPCWLIQVPHKLLSYGAKLLYGRLAQWSNTKGIVYRSSPQLSKELGMGTRTIERFINELKECKLIGTYHPKLGGQNHFEFYDHEWMHRDLAKELSYEESNNSSHNETVPPAYVGGTPPPNLAVINNKEIKINNIITESVSDTEKKPNIAPKVAREQSSPITAKELVSIYHEVLPESPKIKVVDQQLERQLKKLQKDWPNYSPTKSSFSVAGFKKFLEAIKQCMPRFLEPYETASGLKKCNNLRTITRPLNIAKIINGEFNFS